MNKYVIIHGQLRELPENELKHYGVIGMKWGVRRYQNKDGSLTEAGQRLRQLNSDAGDAKYNIRRAGTTAIYRRTNPYEVKKYQDEMESHCNRLLNSIMAAKSAINLSDDDGSGRFQLGDADTTADMSRLYEAHDRVKRSVRDAIDAIGSKYMTDSTVEDYVRTAVDELDSLYQYTYDYR